MKEKIREGYMLQRKGVSDERRREARELVHKKLLEMTKDYHTILSYYPLPDELDITPFNKILEKENRLSLPKICGEDLVPHSVSNMENQLKTFSHRFLEPDFSCPKTENIDLVIVPGIVFDKTGARVCFGKGHYDKFFHNNKIATIGVCFKEQIFDGKLPQESHDITMERLCIV